MILKLRTPLFCLLIVLTIIIHYKKHKHLKSESSKIFQYFTYTALIFIFSIGAMEYTVYNRELFPNIINTTLDNIVYISMILLCYLYTLFIMNYAEISRRKHSKENKCFLKIISFLSIMTLLFFPTVYIDTPYGSCTLGIKAYITYGIIIIHFLLNSYYLVVCKKTMLPIHYKSFSHTMFVFIVTYILQSIFPYVTITHMAFTLEVVILYLNFENVEKYIDEFTNLFNEKAFYKILEEKIFYKQKEKIMLFAFDTMESEEKLESVLCDFYDYLSKNKCDGYKLSENVVAIFVKEKRDFLIRYEKNKNDVTTKTFEINETNKKDIDLFINNNYDTKLYLDKMTKVFNRDKYEIDKKNINDRKENLWYVIIDVNNLKETNDTFGHLKGDELIQNVANILREGFPFSSQIYRIGGDEFVVITSVDNIENNIKTIKHKCFIAKSSIPISFAVGYNKYNPQFDVYEEIVQKADSLMYEDKRKYKENLKIGK